MKWKGVDRSTTLLLGAGATRGAFNHALINGKRIKAPLNSDFFTIAEKFVKAYGPGHALKKRYERLRRVFKDELPTRGRWPISMEEAFSFLYVSKDFPQIYATRRGPKRPPGTRQEIEDFLRLTFGLLSEVESNVRSGTTLYDSLVANLHGDDKVLTLNYDTMLDSSLIRAGWNPTKGYGLTGSHKKFKWRTAKPQLVGQYEHVRLYKLHGSLNWYVKASFDRLQRVFEAKPSRVLVGSTPRVAELGGHVRQIVPPIYGKFFRHTHWSNLWKKAHTALVESEVLVVIGCSLVDTDFHLTGLLRHAVQRRKSQANPFERVVLVDSVKIRRKWMQVLKGCSKKVEVYPKFEHFAESQLR